MPATFDREVIARAKEMYTQEGEKPSDIVKRLDSERWTGKLKVPGKRPQDIRVPESATTITRWANRYRWSPHWREALKNLLSRADPEVPFGVTGIKDPILYLAERDARRFLYPYTLVHPHFTDHQILAATIVHVSNEWDLGTVALRYLEPLISQEIPRAREAKWQSSVWPKAEADQQEELRRTIASAEALLKGDQS